MLLAIATTPLLLVNVHIPVEVAELLAAKALLREIEKMPVEFAVDVAVRFRALTTLAVPVEVEALVHTNA